MKRGQKLRFKGVSDTAQDKQQIQDLVRACVILRDGGCILDPNKAVSTYFQSARSLGLNPLRVPACGGYAKDGHLILQADHLLTRANSATYADTRLIVCVCKAHHGWKKWHKEEYDALLRQILPKDRVDLWNRAQEDSWRATRKYSTDWKLHIIALKAELAKLQ